DMHGEQTYFPTTRMVATLLAIALASCATERSPRQPSGAQAGQQVAPPQSQTAESEDTFRADAPQDNREAIIERGSGSFIGPVPVRARQEPSEGNINLRFQNTDLKEFAAVVLGDLLGLNFVIDPTVAGAVTIQTSTPITSDQLLPLFEEILAIHDAALVRTD